MRRRTKALATTAALGMLAAGAWVWSSHRADAADHNDPPARVMAGGSPDRAADIGDLYAWHDGTKTIFVLTYAGPNDPVAGQSATYDADVLYGIHIDNDGDRAADHDLWIRFGQSASGNWGIQVEGIPGGDPIAQAGAVEIPNRITGPTDAFFWAGLREDPFFFDLQGFQETLGTGALSFDSARDSFAGKNISAIVIQLETADLMAGTDTFDVWATTARIGG